MLTNIKATFEKTSRNFSNGTKAVIFFLLLILIISPIIIIGQVRKNVTFMVDENPTKVVTYKSNLKDILTEADIELAPEDIIALGLDSKIKDGQIVEIKKAVNVTINVDGKQVKIKSAQDNIDALLKSEECLDTLKNANINSIRSGDRILPDIEEPLAEGSIVNITRMDTRVETKSQQLDYQVVTENDSNVYVGERSVVQNGQIGHKEVEELVSLEDGVEVSRKVVAEKITLQPVNQVIREGSKPKQVQVVSSRGETIPYAFSRVLTMRATAYSKQQEGLTDRTATGEYVIHDESGYSTIAVDPRVIPLGTKLYISGYGLAIASDTGGAIIDDRIDVYFDTIAECTSWGIRSVEVYVLE